MAAAADARFRFSRVVVMDPAVQRESLDICVISQFLTGIGDLQDSSLGKASSTPLFSRSTPKNTCSDANSPSFGTCSLK